MQTQEGTVSFYCQRGNIWLCQETALHPLNLKSLRLDSHSESEVEQIKLILWLHSEGCGADRPLHLQG